MSLSFVYQGFQFVVDLTPFAVVVLLRFLFRRPGGGR